MKWIDIRFRRPNPNGFKRLYVISNPFSDYITVELAEWHPIRGYTEGVFTKDTNNCFHPDTTETLNVLYWMPTPKLPEGFGELNANPNLWGTKELLNG